MSFNGNSNVTDFLSRLHSQVPKKRDFSQVNQRQIEKIFMSFRGAQGRYQCLPFNSVVTDYPFAVMNSTYEVNVRRRSKAADGTEIVNDAWIRLFHPDSDMYQTRDLTGRVVSSLTTADVELIAQARGLWEQVWAELDGDNTRDEMVTKLVRKKNYTIFFGYCLNYWANDSRTPTRSNFPALYVIPSKSFLPAVQSNIEEKTQMDGGDVSWISNVYNRNLTGRDGFLVFSVNKDPNRAGYLVTCSHEIGRAAQLQNVAISEEDAELMSNPCLSFLGWQAPKDADIQDPTTVKLFNPDMYREACTFLAEVLTGIRSAKAAGIDVKTAIDTAVATTLAAQPVRGAKTNDPVLAAQQPTGEFNPNVGADPTKVAANTTVQNPAAATLDPISGMPVGNNEPKSAPASPFGDGGTNPFGGSPFGGGFGAGFGK